MPQQATIQPCTPKPEARCERFASYIIVIQIDPGSRNKMTPPVAEASASAHSPPRPASNALVEIAGLKLEYSRAVHPVRPSKVLDTACDCG